MLSANRLSVAFIISAIYISGVTASALDQYDNDCILCNANNGYFCVSGYGYANDCDSTSYYYCDE